MSVWKLKEPTVVNRILLSQYNNNILLKIKKITKIKPHTINHMLIKGCAEKYIDWHHICYW